MSRFLQQGAEQRTRVLAGLFEFNPKTSRFQTGVQRAVKFWSCKTEIKDPETIRVTALEAGGTTHETLWKHNGYQILGLSRYTMGWKFSGDPEGSTTPIGMLESLELPTDEVRRLNNTVFYTEP